MLSLNEVEIFHTRVDVLAWSVVAMTGLISVLTALFLPDEHRAAAGFVYWTLAISMPVLGVCVAQLRKRI